LPAVHQLPPTSSVNQKPKGNVCPRCEKPVYFAEEVKAAGQVKTDSDLCDTFIRLFSHFINYVTNVLTVERISVVQTFQNIKAIFMITVRVLIILLFIIFILFF
jgi:hypothetical protein